MSKKLISAVTILSLMVPMTAAYADVADRSVYNLDGSLFASSNQMNLDAAKRNQVNVQKNQFLYGLSGKYYAMTDAFTAYQEANGDMTQFATKLAAKPEVNANVLNVTAVNTINANTLEVAFPALTAAKTGVTVTVKDSTGAEVAVKSRDLVAGATFAQFDFVTTVPTANLTGVWAVNGVNYSFTAIKQLSDITTAASANNQVALSTALSAASIANVKAENIATYATNIATATPAPAVLADIQKIIDDTNKAALDLSAQAAIVKTVEDAKDQLALYTALKNNFARVNSAWAVDYANGANNAAAGFIINGSAANEAVVSTGVAKADLTYTNIQTTIDAVNATKIAAADTAATTATAQADVTTLIQLWTKDDVAPATTKANAVKASQVKEAVLRVKEATTQNSTYSALVSLANLDATTLKTTDLNVNLASFYYTEQQKPATQTALAAKTVASVTTSITGPANAASLGAAMTDVTTKFTALNSDPTNVDKKAEFKTALQELATYTAHLTGTSKFDMSIVKDDNLVAYSAEFAVVTAISGASSVANVVAKINTTDAAQALTAAVDTINNVASTSTDVRTALINVAVALNTGGSQVDAAAFINLSPQAKLEVAQLVIDNRPVAPGYANLAAIMNATNGSGAIKTQQGAFATKIGQFNAIGDLSGATTTATKTALDTYAYAPYIALSAANKLAVAEKVNALTKDVSGTATPLNFGGADAVTTQAQANAIIDAAIAAIQ